MDLYWGHTGTHRLTTGTPGDALFFWLRLTLIIDRSFFRQIVVKLFLVYNGYEKQNICEVHSRLEAK